MKFAHIADTHIRNLKYHKEYRAVFQELYKNLRKEKPDYIIHCGDIAHTKTQISPEFVEMCTDFFRNLADIAPTYVILGNHDGNLKNSSRQDALTPIAAALNHPNLHLLKDSGETVLDDGFALNVLSVFDTDNWVEPTSYDRVNIALYHGSISGCKTDLVGQWSMVRMILVYLITLISLSLEIFTKPIKCSMKQAEFVMPVLQSSKTMERQMTRDIWYGM